VIKRITAVDTAPVSGSITARRKPASPQPGQVLHRVWRAVGAKAQGQPSFHIHRLAQHLVPHPVERLGRNALCILGQDESPSEAWRVDGARAQSRPRLQRASDGCGLASDSKNKVGLIFAGRPERIRG